MRSARRRTRGTPRFAQLLSFAEFWRYEDAARQTCCLFVDEDTVEGDEDVFTCDVCAVRQQIESLDTFNTYVWGLYRQVVTRLAADLHAGGAVLQALTKDLSADEFAETWRRLVLLYNVIDPPPERRQE